MEGDTVGDEIFMGGLCAQTQTGPSWRGYILIPRWRDLIAFQGRRVRTDLSMSLPQLHMVGVTIRTVTLQYIKYYAGTKESRMDDTGVCGVYARTDDRW